MAAPILLAAMGFLLCSFYSYQVEGQNFFNLTTILQPPPSKTRVLPTSYRYFFWTWIFPNNLVFSKDGALCGWIFRGSKVSSPQMRNLPLWRVYEKHPGPEYRIRKSNKFTLVPSTENGVYQYILTSPLNVKAEDVVGIQYERNPFQYSHILQLAYVDRRNSRNRPSSYISDNKRDVLSFKGHGQRRFESVNRYIPLVTPIIYHEHSTTSINPNKCSSLVMSYLPVNTISATSYSKSDKTISQDQKSKHILPSPFLTPVSTAYNRRLAEGQSFLIFGIIAGIVVISIGVLITIVFISLLVRFKVKKKVQVINIPEEDTLCLEAANSSEPLTLPLPITTNTAATDQSSSHENNDDCLDKEVDCSAEYYNSTIFTVKVAAKQSSVEDTNTPTEGEMTTDKNSSSPNVYCQFKQKSEYNNIPFHIFNARLGTPRLPSNNKTKLQNISGVEQPEHDSGNDLLSSADYCNNTIVAKQLKVKEGSNSTKVAMVAEGNALTSNVSEQCKQKSEYYNSASCSFDMKPITPTINKKFRESLESECSDEDDEYSYVLNNVKQITRQDGGNGYY